MSFCDLLWEARHALDANRVYVGIDSFMYEKLLMAEYEHSISDEDVQRIVEFARKHELSFRIHPDAEGVVVIFHRYLKEEERDKLAEEAGA
ncbi:hypothetical protein E3E26_06875 [Thermococcus sp. LS1]|uniref:hypothetical protein n=1 Tax=Thermococcus sp. LS1 TaxID=1638259 RepID=UPI00143907F7|nr:hypothetical protein [Thermococcus sp. LS1]NJD99506.1 hypothetical protein [Thermococcus sp. LS1]